MKKLISFLLVFCLVLGVASVALAAPKITKQPESATTDEKGTVSFSIKASGYKGLTWRFVNPATGEETTGKKLNSIFKKIKVANPNGHTITLKNVPEEMHGWYVYCHLTGNGFEVDSDRVLLLVYGLPEPDGAALPAVTQPAETSTPDGVEVTTESLPPEDPSVTETSPAPQPSEEPQPQTYVDENGNLVEGIREEVKTITVRAKDATLYPIDSYGRLAEDGAAAELTFEGSGDLAVRANGEIRYWLVNGIRFDTEETISGFTLRDIKTDLVITAVLRNQSGQEIDENNLVTITCEGCKFTWNKGGLKNAVSGEVPAGSEILIIANPAPSSGYSLNGGPFEDAGKMSVRRIVTEDTTIKAE